MFEAETTTSSGLHASGVKMPLLVRSLHQRATVLRASSRRATPYLPRWCRCATARAGGVCVGAASLHASAGQRGAWQPRLHRQARALLRYNRAHGLHVCFC